MIAAHSTVHEVSRMVESSTGGLNIMRKLSNSKLGQVETCCLYKITFDAVQCSISPNLWAGSEESLDKISTQSDISTFSELPTPTSIKTTDSDVFSQKSIKFAIGETQTLDKCTVRQSCDDSDGESPKGVDNSGNQQFCYPPSPNPKTRKSMLKNLRPARSTSSDDGLPSEVQKSCLQNLDLNRSSQRLSILTVKQHFEVCVEPSDSSDASDQSDDANDETLLCDKPDSGFNSASSTPSTALLQS